MRIRTGMSRESGSASGMIAAIGDLIDTIGFYAIVACLVGLLLSRHRG